MKTRIIDEIIEREGGYSNDAADSGGETMYGVTKAVARSFGYTGPMNRMPRELAVTIYTERYWSPIRGDVLAKLAPQVAEEMADTAVNMGVGRAAEFLQRALNAFNQSGVLYSDVVVDRSVGPATLGALAKYLAKRDEVVLVKALNCMQGSFYIELVEQREKDEAFLYGWIKNRVTI